MGETRQKPLFIAFEGIEGSGKTTQTELLARWMSKNGFPVLATREPTKDLLFGKLALSLYQATSPQEALRSEFDSLLQSEEYQRIKNTAHEKKRLYIEKFEDTAKSILAGNDQDIAILLQIIITLDRHDHLLKTIIPALQEGKHVISDRYFMSTPAYAVANGSAWPPYLQMQFNILGEDFLSPDVLFYLSLSVSVGLRRTQKKQNRNKEYFDTAERQQRIQHAYEELLADSSVRSKLKTVITIDGDNTPENIHKKIVGELHGKTIL